MALVRLLKIKRMGQGFVEAFGYIDGMFGTGEDGYGVCLYDDLVVLHTGVYVLVRGRVKRGDKVIVSGGRETNGFKEVYGREMGLLGIDYHRFGLNKESWRGHFKCGEGRLWWIMGVIFHFGLEFGDEGMIVVRSVAMIWARKLQGMARACKGLTRGSWQHGLLRARGKGNLG
ncbi:unnamed protein product [Dovyalis caffra]|uniref:Uncharacterized protein n=1 Tax=Dovyalis caffra TaxID=77055 RepID=A0AAV1RPL0_9ROSI|nr:unnamed protein product [Dovyalis caffra]